MQSTLLIFALLFAYGLRLASKEEDLYENLARATGIVADTTWIIEMVDIVKDWIYLYIFKHNWWAYITLIISIVLPISIADAVAASGTGGEFIRHFLMFLGFTVEENYPKYIRVDSTIAIALIENVP